MSTETTQLNTGARLAMMGRAANVAGWAGHAWARYPEWAELERIAREASVAEWPARIEDVTRAAMEKAAAANPVARQVIFMAGRLAPGLEWSDEYPPSSAKPRALVVAIGAHDQLRAYVSESGDTYVYRGARRRAVMLEVQYDEWGDAVAARFRLAKAARGRDVARVVAAAMAANRGAKYCIQDALPAVLSPKRAQEYALRILDAGNAGHILAR